MHHVVATEAAKHEAEHGRADQDDEDHAVICVVRSTTGTERRAERAFDRRQQNGADRADRSRFGRRREAAEDRAKHRDDQEDGRDQRAKQRAKRGPSARAGIGGTPAGAKDRHPDRKII